MGPSVRRYWDGGWSQHSRGQGYWFLWSARGSLTTGVDSSLLGHLEMTPLDNIGIAPWHRIGCSTNLTGLTWWSVNCCPPGRALIPWTSVFAGVWGHIRKGCHSRPQTPGMPDHWQKTEVRAFPGHSASQNLVSFPKARAHGTCQCDGMCQFVFQHVRLTQSGFTFLILWRDLAGLYVPSLHVKESVVHKFSQGTHSLWPSCRLENRRSNFHTLLRSFCKSWLSNLYSDGKLYN